VGQAFSLPGIQSTVEAVREAGIELVRRFLEKRLTTLY
jgi:hypothetical protein